MCCQRALRLFYEFFDKLYHKVGVICAAKGHFDNMPAVLFLHVVIVGVICAAKGHFDLRFGRFPGYVIKK